MGIELTGGVEAVVVILRLALGVMIVLHGWNHLWGPGGVSGTAQWFASIGFRPARVHALMSGVVELAVGVGLIVGFLVPIACAGLIGTMLVAGWAAHRPNGFFIFRDGYEYVLIVAVAALTLATFGPGQISLDSVFGIVDYDDPSSPGLLGWVGAVIAGGGGVIGGALLLAVGWRPVRQESAE